MIDIFFIGLFLLLIFYTVYGFIKLGIERMDWINWGILYSVILVSIMAIVLLSFN